MKLQGTQTLDAPRDVVWAALLDPEVLAKTLPGVTRLERAGGDRFEASMNIKVGPVQGKFDGHVALSDLDPGKGYRMALHGQGAPGFVEGRGAITLAEAPEGGTALGYDLDVQVGGRLAGVGQRLLETTAKSLSRQAIESLGRQVAARAAAAGGEAVAAPEAPTVGALAAGVSRDLAAELVPPSRRPWLIVALLVAVVIVILLLRAC
jgi:carbon monoxide dehydrogenase subunit G